jgi:twitching motility protein PilI
MTAAELISLLEDYEARASSLAEGLPQYEESYAHWDGIAFIIMGASVVAGLHDVKEILNLPAAVTRVPGTQGWMLGIANIRGNLLPIVDLQVFLGGKAITIGKRSRVLVIDHEGIRVGLLVGGVQGIRHFRPEQRSACAEAPTGLERYCADCFDLGDERWPIFDVRHLAEDDSFQMAAL